MDNNDHFESYLRTAMYKAKECISLAEQEGSNPNTITELHWLHGYLEAGWRYYFNLTQKEKQ